MTLPVSQEAREAAESFWCSPTPQSLEEAFARFERETLERAAKVADEYAYVARSDSIKAATGKVERSDWLGLKIPNLSAEALDELCDLVGINTDFDEYTFSIKRGKLRAVLAELKAHRLASLAPAPDREQKQGVSDPASPSGARERNPQAVSALRASPPIAGWLEPYRSMDASGSPEAAGVVADRWFCELAKDEGERNPDGLEIHHYQYGIALYRGTEIIAFYTIFRDPMNFSVLMRWSAQGIAARSDETRHAAQPERQEPGGEAMRPSLSTTIKGDDTLSIRASLVELERYADEKTSEAFSAMARAETDHDTDYAAQMRRERDAYSDMTMRLRAIGEAE